MPTSIHIPPALLETVDREARAQGVSRNRFIVQTLEQTLEQKVSWSADLWEALNRRRSDLAVAELLEVIRASRSSKGPVRF